LDHRNMKILQRVNRLNQSLRNFGILSIKGML